MKKRYLYVVMSCVLLMNIMPVSAAAELGQSGSITNVIQDNEGTQQESNDNRISDSEEPKVEEPKEEEPKEEEPKEEEPKVEEPKVEESDKEDSKAEVLPEEIILKGEKEGTDAEIEKLGEDSFEREGTKIIKYIGAGGDVVIPSWCTEIGEKAFSKQENVTSVAIPGSVKIIGEYAFQDCRQLNSFSLASGVEIIGREAFSHTAITNLVVPNSVRVIDNSAFSWCLSLKNIVLGENVVDISYGMFTGCQSLESVIFGKKVNRIGARAFRECSSLIAVKLPSSVEVIEYEAFKNCSKLSSLDMGSGVTTIEGEAFRNCVLLKEIIWSKSLINIGLFAFGGAAITELTLPESVITVGDWCFYSCSALKTISLGQNIAYIPSYMFSNCSLLQNVELSESVTFIREGAFKDCKSLKRVDLPYGITAIADNIVDGSDNVVFYAYSDSYGYKWARDNGKKYVSLGTYKPSPVTNLKALPVGNSRTNLTWTASKGAEGYLIYAQKNGKYAYCGMTTKGTSFTDIKALDSNYNFYWVFPYVKDSTGKMYSGGCTKYVFAKGVTVAVTDLKAASQTGGVRITWTKSAGAEGYLVYGKTATGAYGYKGMTTQGTTFVDKKAPKSEYSFYWVYPYHKDGNGKMIVGGTPKYVFGKAK